MYLPGDTVLITDIGEFGLSLMCVTSNVNTQCCMGPDGGNWYFPNGTIVPRNGAAPTADFTRSGHAQQVRLNRRNGALMPTGVFDCRVPDTTSVEQRASITISRGQ